MTTTLFTQAYAPFLALGVGQLGGRAAAAGCLEASGERIPWAACDSRRERLLATGLERKLLVELPDMVAQASSLQPFRLSLGQPPMQAGSLRYKSAEPVSFRLGLAATYPSPEAGAAGSAEPLARGAHESAAAGPSDPQWQWVTAALAAQREALEALCEDRALVVLFGALGELAAGLLLAALGAELREARVPVCVIGVDPFALEGSAAAAAAEEAAARLARTAGLFLRLPAGPLLASLSAGATLPRAYQGAEEAVVAAVQALLGALAGADTPAALAIPRLRRALRGAGALTAAVGSATGAGAPAAALERALDPAGMPAANRAGLARWAVALTAGRELSVGEAAAIRARLQQDRDPRALALLALGVDSALGEEAHCLVMVRPAPSPNVVAFGE